MPRDLSSIPARQLFRERIEGLAEFLSGFRELSALAHVEGWTSAMLVEMQKNLRAAAQTARAIANDYEKWLNVIVKEEARRG